MNFISIPMYMHITLRIKPSKDYIPKNQIRNPSTSKKKSEIKTFNHKILIGTPVYLQLSN